MKKRRILSGIAITAAAVIAIIAAFSTYFYLTKLKPRIDFCMSIVDAYKKVFDEGEYSLAQIGDDTSLLFKLDDNNDLSAAFYLDESHKPVYGGYTEAGIWLKLPDNKTEYMIPWSDDTLEQLEGSYLSQLLKLSDKTKTDIAESLTDARRLIYEDEEVYFKPTLLNRMLGLSCLKSDVLDFYKNISFRKVKGVSVETDDGTVLCEQILAHIPEKYVKLLFETDGTGAIGTLGDLLGDADVSAYIAGGKLISCTIETTVRNMPLVHVNNILASGESGLITKSDVLVKADISLDGKYAIADVSLAADELSLAATVRFSSTNDNKLISYDYEEALNIFKAGRLRLLLEFTKAKDYITN